MTISIASSLARVRGLALVLAWLVTASPCAIPVAAHGAVTGSVLAWGLDEQDQTNVPADLSNVTAIAGGGFHTVALKRDGTVVAWGGNESGQSNVPAGLRHVIAIAAGELHTLALKRDGTVVGWGQNIAGETTPPAGLHGVRAIATGLYHTVALKRDGTVVAWGDNHEGQTDVPAALQGVRAIAAGRLHAVALKSDGTVVAWGWNGQGQTNIPAGLHGVMAVAAGDLHTLALKSSYRFGGFLGPVNALPVVNTVAAGTGVPVRFRLGADQGLDIFTSGFPASRWMPCRTDAATDEIEHTVPASGDSLRYDAATGIYTFIWKTDSAWRGQCRRLILRLADGIEHSTVFHFR